MRYILLTLVIVSFVFTSCKKNKEVFEEEITTEENLLTSEINPNFDWKTTKEVSLELNSYTGKMVYIKSENGGAYHVVLVKSNSYKTTVTLPSYVETAYIHCQGKVTEIELNNNSIIHTFS